MDFERLRKVNFARCVGCFHDIDDWSVSDWATALAGECGEVCDAVKKLRRLECGTGVGKRPDTYDEGVGAIADELADTVIYADLLASKLGIHLEDAVRAKFNRYSHENSLPYYL